MIQVNDVLDTKRTLCFTYMTVILPKHLLPKFFLPVLMLWFYIWHINQICRNG